MCLLKIHGRATRGKKIIVGFAALAEKGKGHLLKQASQTLLFTITSKFFF
jgi:hypothetical protein